MSSYTDYTDPRPLMVEIAHLLYSRYLTNSAGGNMSCRVGDRIYITPRGLGREHRWQLREEMVLVFENGANDLNPLTSFRPRVAPAFTSMLYPRLQRR